jgi:hypothetical protein
MLTASFKLSVTAQISHLKVFLSLLIGDFYQFAPVLKTSLLVDRMVDLAYMAP